MAFNLSQKLVRSYLSTSTNLSKGFADECMVSISKPTDEIDDSMIQEQAIEGKVTNILVVSDEGIAVNVFIAKSRKDTIGNRLRWFGGVYNSDGTTTRVTGNFIKRRSVAIHLIHTFIANQLQ